MLHAIEVRYDGKDATQHLIAADQLAESMAGFSRILATVGHFAVTGEFVKRSPAQDVRVMVAAPEARCYSVLMELWEATKQHQAFQGLVGSVILAAVTYIVAKAANRNSEMKHLAAALQAALAQNGQRDAAVLDRMMQTIEHMADALRPAVKQAVAPIGNTCSTVMVGGSQGVVIDEVDKANILAASPVEITNERTFSCVITELDRENATGKVRLQGDDEARIPITITDPIFKVLDNPYMMAFMTVRHINLIGKAELSEGEIKRIYVANSS